MFTESFKYYKAKCPPPDLSDVIDFDDNYQQNCTRINLTNDLNEHPGLKLIQNWEVFEIKNRPGLIFIKNPFLPKGQQYWISRCLQDYPNFPHHNNLKLTNSQWWVDLQKITDLKMKDKFRNSLRWCTLGYHHNWDTKIYNEEQKNGFPLDLQKLTTYIAKVFKYSEFNPEAAIVNYYSVGTTLAGHTDHSEVNLDAPLFSISFGQSAIFLIGGQTKNEKPSAIMLKSGDVLIMSKESRLCYHAVPKILKTAIKPWNQNIANNEGEETFKTPEDEDYLSYLRKNCLDDIVWANFEEYISECRININIRQVLKNGQKALCDS